MNETVFPGYEEYQAQQYSEAYSKLLPIAEAGDAEAQCMVGTLYQMGLGVKPDIEKAEYWYERASQRGSGVATNNLAGILAMRGQREESARLYKLSKAQGFNHGPTLKERTS